MYKLHSICQSGNAYKVALLLQALNQPWQAEFVDFMKGISRDESWRENSNELGEIPILEDGDLRLTQSGVILTYLADKHAAYGGKTEEEKREILRWILFDNHKFTSYFASHRFMKSFGPAAPDVNVMGWLRQRMDNAFLIVDKHLATRPYIVGDSPTIADMSMSAYLFYPEEEFGYPVASRFTHIGAWLDRLRGLPGWTEPYAILPGERIMPKW